MLDKGCSNTTILVSNFQRRVSAGRGRNACRARRNQKGKESRKRKLTSGGRGFMKRRGSADRKMEQYSMARREK